jgi:hypothetical protein
MTALRAPAWIRFGTLWAWLAAHDRGFAALRRAGRTAIVMPAMFAIGDKVLDNPQLATFAAFGSFAQLLLVDFGGPRRDRLLAQAALSVTGAVFICLATLASRNAWLAAAAMTVVGLAVLFAGVVSSVLAGASTSLLLAFILPVSLPAHASDIGDRLAGWALASGAAWLAVALLWPAPSRDPLGASAASACRAIANRLRADIDYLAATANETAAQAAGVADAVATHQAAVAGARAAVASLRRVFLATPYRPTGLSTGARAVVRLVDELSWLDVILSQARVAGQGPRRDHDAGRVKSAAAAVLEHGADSLEHADDRAVTAPDDALDAALAQLGQSLRTLEQHATRESPADAVDALDPSFRAQELSFAVNAIGANIRLAAMANRRPWLQRLLGQPPQGLSGPWVAAQERAAAHVQRDSLWLHNSVRGAVGLGLAVLVANLTGVQHSFWVVLGTLSVLRSNALNTGQNALRAVLGTAVGFAIGAVLLVPIGTNTTVLWILLPIAILLAGVAPSAISFAAGQAAFTLTLVILFNIIQPAGWRVGLLRVEDIALGCGISLVVGVLFWPRGAAAALNRALAEAYVDSADYLAAAVSFGMQRCDTSAPPAPPPTHPAADAAAASRRLDDTFRGYLAERGAKPVPLAEMTALLTGVAGIRLAADAVLDLWARDDGGGQGQRDLVRHELTQSTESVRDWYVQLAGSLLGSAVVPTPARMDAGADARLLAAVRHDLPGPAGHTSSTAVRMIWTGDHLDAARRLQEGLVDPAAAAITHAGAGPDANRMLGWWRALA